MPLFFAIFQLALIWHVKTHADGGGIGGRPLWIGLQPHDEAGVRTEQVVDESFGTDFEAACRLAHTHGSTANRLSRSTVHRTGPGAGVLGADRHGRDDRSRDQGSAAMSEPPRRRRRAESGSALVEFTWLALLLMIPLVYVVITLVTVQRSAYGATEAARAAGRAYILAPDVETARERARRRGCSLAMRDQGVDDRAQQTSRSAASRRRSRVCSQVRRSRSASSWTSSCRWYRRSTGMRRRRSRSMRHIRRRTGSTENRTVNRARRRPKPGNSRS